MRFSLKIFCTQNIAERVGCNGVKFAHNKLSSTSKVRGFYLYQKKNIAKAMFLFFGGDGRARTYDLMHVKHAL